MQRASRPLSSVHTDPACGPAPAMLQSPAPCALLLLDAAPWISLRHLNWSGAQRVTMMSTVSRPAFMSHLLWAHFIVT